MASEAESTTSRLCLAIAASMVSHARGAQFRRCLGGGLWGHVAREGGEELGLRRVGCVLLGKYRAGMMLLGETSYARAELCLRVTRSMRRYPGGS